MRAARALGLLLVLLASQTLGCSEGTRLIGRLEPASEDGGGSPPPPPPDAGDAGSDGGAVVQPVLPLHTQSRFIVDASNRRFRLSSVVWYGAESPDLVPYGLDFNALEGIAQLIRQLGFNSVRLPWCNQMLESNPVVPDALLRANPGLLGKSALEVFDAVIQALGDAGLLVILDNHRSRGEWCCDVAHGDGLWHTPEYPESSWVADWESLVRRYASAPFVIAADVRDAPRAQLAASAPASCTDCGTDCPCDVAAWGGSDPATDWPSAAERVGNAILAINPDLLIVVEGIELSRTIPASGRPITLNVPNRVVYSPHVYPYTYNGIMQFASYDEFKTTLDAEWGYLLQPGQPYTGPVWLVFGASHTGGDATFWERMLRYAQENDVEWAYWAVNGTQGNGYSRSYGDEEPYGVLNIDWDGPASLDHLAMIQTLPR